MAEKSAFNNRLTHALKILAEFHHVIKNPDYTGMTENEVRDLHISQNRATMLRDEYIYYVALVRLIPRKDIAEALGLSVSAVSKILKKFK